MRSLSHKLAVAAWAVVAATVTSTGRAQPNDGPQPTTPSEPTPPSAPTGDNPRARHEQAEALFNAQRFRDAAAIWESL